MLVVLDTNIFCADFKLVGGRFRTLLAAVDAGIHRLSVPEIVIDETVGKYASAVDAGFGSAQKALNDLDRLYPKQPTLDERLRDAAKEDYRPWLLGTLRDHSCRVLPYPDVPHSEIAQRAIARTMPFRDKKQDGYRDTLVWLTILDLVKTSADRIAFVTSNKHDFAAGDQLHEHLSDDLVRVGLRANSVKLFTSLESFVEEFCRPNLPVVDSSIVATAGAKQLDPALRMKLEAHLRKRVFDRIERGGDDWELDSALLVSFAEPTEFDSVEFSGLSAVDPVPVDDVRTLDESTLTIRVTAICECELLGFCGRGVWRPSRFPGWSLVDDHYDDDTVVVSSTQRLPLALQLVTDDSGKDLLSLEL
ncbi:MAG TPA: PIN domain-containing protein [Dehalococcoidia bacterium]|nr:PIN domain-containing protein [Dehalococcoidia bacterium]